MHSAIVSVDKPKSTFLLSAGDVNLFLAEQKRGLEEKFGGFLKMFPDNGKLITFHEARILAVISTIRRVTQHYQDGVDYVEGMLRSQLVAAIGKEVIPNDFSEYMLYHYRKIFRPEFQPHPFSYAIRQPAHDLEGVIDILGMLYSCYSFHHVLSYFSNFFRFQLRIGVYASEALTSSSPYEVLYQCWNRNLVPW